MAAALADRPNEYARLGLEKGCVQPWEDGMRTDGHRGSYEWWYLDGRLEDGSALVVVFYTKSPLEPTKPLSPYFTFNLDRADGSSISREVRVSPEQFSASKEGCQVRIGQGSFSGDLHSYRIHVEDDGLSADLVLTARVPPWRPGTGYFRFGEDEHRYFAWLPSVPEGLLEGTVTLDGHSEEIRGSGYHDHNWGEVSMHELIHHWYWGRATIGDFTAITAFITAEKQYRNATIPIFMLAREGQILLDDARKVRFSTGEIHTDEATGKPVPDLVVYDYEDGEERYRLAFKREKTILTLELVDLVHGLKHLAARLLGFDGVYLRFSGRATLERVEAGDVTDNLEQEAIFELMYLGRTSP
jgi:CrtC N-terminal lipocalin domain